jgi:hypothetical protein
MRHTGGCMISAMFLCAVLFVPLVIQVQCKYSAIHLSFFMWSPSNLNSWVLWETADDRQYYCWSMSTDWNPDPVPAGRPQLLEANSTTSLYERKDENFLICTIFKCTYFNPNDLCYCCRDTSRRESCHLTYSECRAHCPIPSPPKFWVAMHLFSL